MKDFCFCKQKHSVFLLASIQAACGRTILVGAPRSPYLCKDDAIHDQTILIQHHSPLCISRAVALRRRRNERADLLRTELLNQAGFFLARLLKSTQMKILGIVISTRIAGTCICFTSLRCSLQPSLSVSF